MSSSTFLGIYTAIYDYTPQTDAELPLQEGDLLYILEKSTEDDWWKAKKRTSNSDEDEPEGLVPSNYIEEAHPIAKHKAIYDYTRQTQEEISFTEDAILDVYDVSDPDWTLVGHNGEFGFAPANYIEEVEKLSAPSEAPEPEQELESEPEPEPARIVRTTLSLPPRSSSPLTPPPASPLNLSKPLPVPSPEDDDIPPPTPPRPAAANNEHDRSPAQERLSAVLRKASKQDHPSSLSHSSVQRSPTYRSHRASGRYSGNYSDSESDDGPRLPVKRPPHERRAMRQQHGHHEERLHPVEPGSPTNIPPGFRSFAVNELIGKKKHAALLALGPGRIILIPDKSTLPRQEWSVEDMLHFSIEGKHVFIDVSHPTKAMDLHAGSKEAAQDIFQALGDINGAVKAAGLREVISAADSKYKRSETIGTIIWDFVASGRDEVSVAAGDEVTILDDREEDLWLVKRTVNGAEGVVPASYVERGRVDIKPSIDGSLRESVSKDKTRQSQLANEHQRTTSSGSLPPGVRLPERTTSLVHRRESQPQSRPDPSKIRSWTDRTGTFKVEAQLLGCKDGKIHLHKSNGVKIAVPIAKMSVQDLEYVEKKTGLSLDEDKPLSALKQQQQQQPQQLQKLGISIQPSREASKTSPKPNEYDWFDFFLNCGIELANCQRYALSFQRESMDEAFMPDINASLLRSMGFKEGDILRVIKVLDAKYNKNKEEVGKKAVSFGSTEVIADKNGNSEGSATAGLFSGPGGALRNNTARSRPAPPVTTNDTVDPKVFEQKPASPFKPSTNTAAPAASNSASKTQAAFEDDAWAPKPSKKSTPPPTEQAAATLPASGPVSAPASTPEPTGSQATRQAPAVTGALKDLSQLSLSMPPLEPTKPPQPTAQIATQPIVSQPFTQPALQVTSQPTGQVQVFSPAVASPLNPQLTIQPAGSAAQRQRPIAPLVTNTSLIPPPPQRPISAPQPYQPNIVQPLTAQLTGLPQGPNPSTLPSIAGGSQMSMTDQLNHMRIQQLQQQQQQLQQLQQQQAALQAQMTGLGGMGQVAPQITNFPGQSSFRPGIAGVPIIQQPQPQPPNASFQSLLSQPTGIIVQPTGLMSQPPGLRFQSSMSFQPSQPLSVPVNSVLAQPLIPQKTAQPPPTSFGSAGLTPLKPQPTGPPPNVKFGLTPGKKLVPQPTGKKANITAATPDNPFGF